MTRASRRIADLYAKQESEPFYPTKMTNDEYQRASTENPEIDSPYTIIRRDEQGELVAIPIHEYFREEIRDKRIVESLNTAAQIAYSPGMRDSELYAYLKSRANAFKTGEWEESEKIWLQMSKPPKVFTVIGPYDTYLDPKGKKYAWQSWTGILDEEATAEGQDFTDKFLNWMQEKTGRVSPRISVRVDNTVIKSGQAAKYEWTGNSMPCQSHLRQEYGSVFTIFKPTFDDKMRGERLPAYRTAVHPTRRQGVTDELIIATSMARYLGHENGHSFTAPDINNRLNGDEAKWVKELYCDTLALQAQFEFAHNRREQEAAFAAYFANAYVQYADFAGSGRRAEYHTGSSIALNYCMRKRSVHIEDGKLFWESDEVDAVVGDLTRLHEIVDEVQSKGSKRDAKELHEKYYREDYPFKRLT